MATLDEAYNNILLTNMPKSIPEGKNIGVLLGKVVNTAFNLYQNGNKYFVEYNGRKLVVNDIDKDSHGRTVELALPGTTYKVIMFGTPYQYKC